MKKTILLFLFLFMFSSVSHAVDYTSDNNCMGAWLMTSSGNETDLSGEGETLTETSGDIPISDSIPYLSGSSRDFEEGDTEYLTHADGGSTDINGANQAISLGAWIYIEELPGAVEDDVIISKFGFGGAGEIRQYYLIIEPDDHIQFCLSNDGTNATCAEGATALSASTWYHVFGVYNDTDMRVYLDGVLDSNGADNPKTYSDGIYDGSAPFGIGAWYHTGSWGSYFDGKITEAGIFDRALSAAEVLDIKNNGLRGTANEEIEVLVQYSFDGDSFATTTNTTGVAGGTLTDSGEAQNFYITSDIYSQPILKVFPPYPTQTASEAVANDSYFSFTVTPTNVEMDLTSLTFNVARAGSTTPRGWVVRSSVDSYASNIATNTIPTVAPTFTSVEVNLSGASYQNISSAITFRLYTYVKNVTHSVDWDDITINGTTSSSSETGMTSDTYEDQAPVITRYIEIERSGTTLTAKIYSDNQYSNLLDTLTVTTTADTHRYLYGAMSYNTGVSGTSFSGLIENLDLDAGSGNPPPVNPPAAGVSIIETGGNITGGDFPQ